jgi:hypothetical protein
MLSLIGLGLMGSLLLSPPALAQLRVIPEAAVKVYQTLPDLPLENTYTGSPETVGPPAENTLVRRMMLYHTQVKGRSPVNRFDWKLTLADYLDANETMVAQSYPAANLVSPNPYYGDRQVIQSLSRVERNALITAMVTAFGGDPTPKYFSITPETTPAPVLSTPTPAATIQLSNPGSADQLQ